jgi:protein O-GlcNAc transferase
MYRRGAIPDLFYNVDAPTFRESMKSSRPTVKPRIGFGVRQLSFVLFLLCLAKAGFPQDNLPPEVRSQIAAGVEALRAGDLDTAERIFSEAEHRGIQHALIFHNLGIVAQQRGNHEQAISRFRRAVLLQDDYGPSHLLLGSSLLALHRNAEALRELKRAASLLPDEPQAHLQLAKAYEASEDWMGVVGEFRKLTVLSPEEPEYAYQLGRAWMRLSGWSYQQMVQINPKSARLQQALGQDYAIQEKYDLAVAAYQRAAQSDPALPEVHLAIATILLEEKKIAEALAEIELELKLVPGSKAAAALKAKIEAAKVRSEVPDTPK